MRSAGRKHIKRVTRSRRAAAFALILPLLCSCEEGRRQEQVTATSSATQSMPIVRPVPTAEFLKRPPKPEPKKKEQPKCDVQAAKDPGCPEGSVRRKWYCIFQFEASLEYSDGTPFPANKRPTKHIHQLNAVSKPCVLPQAFISYEEAYTACKNADMRLCVHEHEWIPACRGAYGWRSESGCNVGKGRRDIKRMDRLHVLLRAFPGRKLEKMTVEFQDPRIPLLGNGINLPPEGEGLGPLKEWRAAGEPLSQEPEDYPLSQRYQLLTGESGCESHASRGDSPVYDMLGNTSEWVLLWKEKEKKPDAAIGPDGGAAPEERNPTRAGMSYSDIYLGDDCEAATDINDKEYRNFAIGFRCCSMARRK